MLRTTGFEALFYVLATFLVVTAVAASSARNVINAVVSLSVFSMILAAMFLILGAPDVAMAEAVIGAGFSTAIFMVAVSKTKEE